jgi:hypothetical protein
MEETKAVAKTAKSTIEKIEQEPSLMVLAQNPDFPVEKLQALIEMKNREEDRQAKKDFEYHFAEMQKEFKPIKRSKRGDKGKYAPVDELVKIYGPIISRHGFSYCWDEEPMEGGSLKIVLTISGYGYSKTNSKILPKYEPDTAKSTGKPIMNSNQAEGTRTTYGCRYTFKAGFGITETDEDTDGEYLSSAQYEPYFKRMEKCKGDDEALLKCTTNCREELKELNDFVGMEILKAYYQKLKGAK